MMNGAFFTSLDESTLSQLMTDAVRRVLSEVAVSTGNSKYQPVESLGTRQEVAIFLDVSVQTVDKLISTNQINGVQVGRRKKIYWDSVRAFAQSNEFIKKGS